MSKYEIIYADPPWSFNNKKTGGSMTSGAASQYDVMTLEQMKQLPVPDLCADNCVLIMWWVGSQPQEALDLCNAWGFTLKNMNGFVWNKLTRNQNPHFGMGFWTRAGSESAIIATRGKPKPVSHSVRAVHSAVVGKHSEKPSAFRNKAVELCGDVPRLEMFARTQTPGWDVFGNQVDNSIEINSKEAA
ncbi:MT-A70 family methyltransferase [Alteromonas pelagimontana]|nr:MT-A70 family methyltransferase [Alteromonas pelagimontana]